ncbi:hypothetical protein ANN_19568 [Periplaneta americana]|uniref:Uncharacterized protein n=1 Tax=Periplaneta americana TaxID=6978 RepID=A0ABQ8SAG5_PERAM|nr:hypothetical protein ANN_19568 [Periplaneta americana]
MRINCLHSHASSSVRRQPAFGECNVMMTKWRLDRMILMPNVGKRKNLEKTPTATLFASPIVSLRVLQMKTPNPDRKSNPDRLRDSIPIQLQQELQKGYYDRPYLNDDDYDGEDDKILRIYKHGIEFTGMGHRGPALRPVMIYCANAQARHIPNPTPADYTKIRCEQTDYLFLTARRRERREVIGVVGRAPEAFENKILRKIFGAKRHEVTGEWRKLHNAELHALYSSPDIIRNIKFRGLKWAGHIVRMGESRNAYRVLVGRPAGKRPLGRSRRRWEDNIKMDLREPNSCQDACLHPLTGGGVLSTAVPEFPAFRNIPARIHSLRALPRALRHLGRAVGVDPVLLVHIGGMNLERGRVGEDEGSHAAGGLEPRPQENRLYTYRSCLQRKKWTATIQLGAPTLHQHDPGNSQTAGLVGQAPCDIDEDGRIHYQEDGTSPHYRFEVHELLRRCFPGRWIGRAGPTA